MPHCATLFIRLIAFFCPCLFLACQTVPGGPWAAFLHCGTCMTCGNCIQEALDVKEAYLKDPKSLLLQFDASHREVDDRFVEWLNLLQDSVLYNHRYSDNGQRQAMRQALVAATQPYVNDPKLGELARSMIGSITMADRLEDNVTGSYEFQLPKDAGSGDLLVGVLDSAHIRFSLQVVGGPPAFNQGFLKGEAVMIAPDKFEYQTTEYGGACRLQFTFDGEMALIKTLEGDAAACGFGHNVRADQRYRRSTADDPFQSAANSKLLKNLEGDWISTADPKSEIKMEQGIYTELYAGKRVNSFIYNFYPVCPRDCNPTGKMPCIQLGSMNVVCFAVLKADSMRLEISMIGHQAGTLSFNRKPILMRH